MRKLGGGESRWSSEVESSQQSCFQKQKYFWATESTPRDFWAETGEKLQMFLAAEGPRTRL